MRLNQSIFVSVLMTFHHLKPPPHTSHQLKCLVRKVTEYVKWLRSASKNTSDCVMHKGDPDPQKHNSKWKVWATSHKEDEIKLLTSRPPKKTTFKTICLFQPSSTLLLPLAQCLNILTWGKIQFQALNYIIFPLTGFNSAMNVNGDKTVSLLLKR